MKRLNKKMHYWLKFFIKLIPFYFLIFSLFNVLFNETIQFDIGSILTDSVGTNNIFMSAVDRLFNNNNVNLTQFNRRFFQILTGFYYDNPNFISAWQVFNFTCCAFEWFIFVDLIDLVLHAFRFIVDFAHDLIDSFSDKSKGGFN